MNISSQELTRIVKLTNRDMPFTDWSLERQKSLEQSKFIYEKSQSDQSNIPMDSASEYYLFNKIGTNSHGDTSLHRLLSTHAPASVVDYFLRSMEAHIDFIRNGPKMENDVFYPANAVNAFKMLGSPPLLHQQNGKGVTALHMAVYRNSWHVEKIVQLLLSADKMAAESDSQPRKGMASISMDGGSFPLHILCGHSLTIRIQVLSALVEADPGVVVKADINGENPLSLLWKNVLRFRWAIHMEQGYKDIDYIDSSLSWMTVISPEQFMRYSLLMIRGYRTHKNSRNDGFDISLHDICDMPNCPPLLLRLALSPKYREIFRVRSNVHTVDEKGKLPLHYASSQPAVGLHSLPPHFRGERIKTVIELLLDEYPGAAMIADSSGRLPLHYALENNSVQDEAVLALVRVFPEGLRRQDPVSGLYPFMHVAAATNQLDVQNMARRVMNNDGSDVLNIVPRDDIGMSFLFLLLCPEALKFQDVCYCL